MTESLVRDSESEKQETSAEETLALMYLSHFSYEVWESGDDAEMRVGDWVELNWQDHNGDDHSDGVGRVVLHHLYPVPIILMNIGFEDNGDLHGDYVPLCTHPYNTISRVSEAYARNLLKKEEREFESFLARNRTQNGGPNA